MASPLRNPWAVALLAVGAFAFLAWRIVPLFRGGASGGGEPPPAEAVAIVDSSGVQASSPVSDPPVLPLAQPRPGDSLGGWDVEGTRDPFGKPTEQVHVRPARRLAGSATITTPRTVGSGIFLRGLATGSANLVLAQGRVLAEGDTLAGGLLRAIRTDRIVVRRPGGDTVFFFPRGNLP